MVLPVKPARRTDVFVEVCRSENRNIHQNRLNHLFLGPFFTARVRSTREGNIYTWKCLSVHFWGGGSHVSDFWEGGSHVSDFWGGSHVSDFGGGSHVSDFWGGSHVSDFGGVPCLRFLGGGSQVSDFQGGPMSQIFGGVPGLSKGKNFWHQIWLDTCSDQKKIFCRGTPPFLVKGKIFDTRFGLIHVQTGEKNFCRGTPPHPRNSKKLLWPRGGRYASCVHAGGLSCSRIKSTLKLSSAQCVSWCTWKFARKEALPFGSITKLLCFCWAD